MNFKKFEEKIVQMHKTISLIDFKQFMIENLDFIKENACEFLFLCIKYNVYFEYSYKESYIYLNEGDKYELFSFCLRAKKEKESLVILNCDIELDSNFVNLISILNDNSKDMEGLTELILLKLSKDLNEEHYMLLENHLKEKIHFIKNVKEF